MLLASRLLSAVCEAFPGDKTRPGLVLAELEYPKRYYASVVRYPNGPNSEKQIVVKATDSTLPKAIVALALAWVVERGQVDRARSFLTYSAKEFEALLTRVLA